MSKYQLKDSDIYYAGTDVPVNKLDIKDGVELHELENELLDEAYETFISELDKQTQFDEAYFQSLHRRTFESLFAWAGEYRNFDMAKGGSRFCRGEFVMPESKKIFAKLESENFLKSCDDMPKEEFARKLAYYKCELIALHPFYEINGRITRLFFDMIAVYNGYEPIDYSNYSPEEYIDASIVCVQQADESALCEMIEKGLKKAAS